MRNINELANAFGEADDGFVGNVRQTLADIRKNSAGRPVNKICFRIAAAVAILCLLSAGTALALSNTWGILDFLSGRRLDVKVLPEASEVVQTDVPQEADTAGYAAFTVREAVYDGQNAYIVVDVVPPAPEYLLLGPDASPSDPVGNMGPLFSGKTGTIADYAKENNMKMIGTSVVINGANCSVDYLLEEDGTLVYMLDGNYAGDSPAAELSINCVSAMYIEKDGALTIDEANRKWTAITATLQNTGTKAAVTSTTSAVYSDCGVRVDKITLTGSEMAIYAQVEFTVVDEDKYAGTDGGLWFEFLDEYGSRMPDGAASSGSVEEVDDTHFIEKVSLQASEKLPGEVILRGYNCWEKNRYETHIFEMN